MRAVCVRIPARISFSGCMRPSADSVVKCSQLEYYGSTAERRGSTTKIPVLSRMCRLVEGLSQNPRRPL